jgi:hypothetical protein
MQKLFIKQTLMTPEINFSPGDNVFTIRGSSSPEDVRAMYYPVIEWIRIFIDDVLNGEYKPFKTGNPLDFKIDLTYFNSSSAKFFYDILTEMQRLMKAGIPVKVTWYYDEEDLDMKEAGTDISQLVEMEFTYVSKSKKS